MVLLARNPDPPEAPAVLPCRLPPCSRPVPLRSALRRTVPASHPRTLAPLLPPFAFAPSRRPALLRSISHLPPPVPASSPLPRLPCQAFARPHRVAPAIRPLRPTPFSLVPVLALLSHTHLAPPHSRVPAPSNPLLLRPAKPSSGLASSLPPAIRPLRLALWEASLPRFTRPAPAALPCSPPSRPRPTAPPRICCHLPVPASSPLPRLPCQAFVRPHLAVRSAPSIPSHPPSHPARPARPVPALSHSPPHPAPPTFRTLLTTLRRAAALPALHRRAAVRISPGGPRWLLFLRLARGSRMPAQGAFGGADSYLDAA